MWSTPPRTLRNPFSEGAGEEERGRGAKILDRLDIGLKQGSIIHYMSSAMVDSDQKKSECWTRRMRCFPAAGHLLSFKYIMQSLRRVHWVRVFPEKHRKRVNTEPK